jgi:hypothetical protein
MLNQFSLNLPAYQLSLLTSITSDASFSPYCSEFTIDYLINDKKPAFPERRVLLEKKLVAKIPIQIISSRTTDMAHSQAVHTLISSAVC